MPTVLSVNPSRRGAKRKSTRKTRAHRRSAPRRKAKRKSRARRYHGLAATRRSYRRNPSRRAKTDLMSQMVPVALGAGGAILTDLALSYVPLPAALQTGMFRPVVKSAAAIGLGLLVGALTSKTTGRAVMAGALTVVAYDAARSFIQTNVPALNLSGISEFPAVEWTDTDGMGELVYSPAGGMGELIDAPDNMAGYGDDQYY